MFLTTSKFDVMSNPLINHRQEKHFVSSFLEMGCLAGFALCNSRKKKYRIFGYSRKTGKIWGKPEESGRMIKNWDTWQVWTIIVERVLKIENSPLGSRVVWELLFNVEVQKSILLDKLFTDLPEKRL